MNGGQVNVSVTVQTKEVNCPVILGGYGGRVKLTGDYTVQASDEGKTIWAESGTTWIVTLPIGLDPPPFVFFEGPSMGSITLHPAAGVELAGDTIDVAISPGVYPSGVGLIPFLDQTDSYGLTLGGIEFGDIGGDPLANGALAALFANTETPEPLPVKESTNDDIVLAYHRALLWMGNLGTDKTLTLHTGLPSNFEFWMQYIGGGAGHLLLAADTGVTISWINGGALVSATPIRLVAAGTMLHVKARDVDTYSVSVYQGGSVTTP